MDEIELTLILETSGSINEPRVTLEQEQVIMVKSLGDSWAFSRKKFLLIGKLDYDFDIQSPFSGQEWQATFTIDGKKLTPIKGTSGSIQNGHLYI